MRALAALAVAALLVACSAPPPAPSETAKKEHPAPTREKPVMTGALTRAQVTDIPAWTSDAVLDDAAAQALGRVAPGAHVQAIIGTWCSDSRRELPRLYRAMDVVTATSAGPAGNAMEGQLGGVPWTLDVVGVDRDKKSPGLTIDVAYVPLFIVTRDGKEVGRIVESAPAGIERDLLSLLDGTRSGVITGRQDLSPPAH